MAKSVPFQLVDINTEQFASFEDQFNPSEQDLNIDFNVELKIDPEQHIIGVFTKYEFSQTSNLILVLECSCSFQIEEAFWEEQIEGDHIHFPHGILTHFLILSIGTARGIIHAKKPKVMQSLLLPTLNVSNVITEDQTFSIASS